MMEQILMRHIEAMKADALICNGRMRRDECGDEHLTEFARKKRDECAKIVEALEGGPMTVEQVKRLIGTSLEAARRRLHYLRDCGLVVFDEGQRRSPSRAPNWRLA